MSPMPKIVRSDNFWHGGLLPFTFREKQYNKIMGNNICFKALVWQFFDVPRAILKAWWAFLCFNLDYFSLPILFKTFFSPWRRYHYPYGRIFEIKENTQVFIFNAMSRIIGSILRTAFIILGLSVEILILVGGLIIVLAWLVLPFFLIFGLIFGIKLLL